MQVPPSSAGMVCMFFLLGVCEHFFESEYVIAPPLRFFEKKSLLLPKFILHFERSKSECVVKCAIHEGQDALRMFFLSFQNSPFPPVFLIPPPPLRLRGGGFAVKEDPGRGFC